MIEHIRRCWKGEEKLWIFFLSLIIAAIVPEPAFTYFGGFSLEKGLMMLLIGWVIICIIEPIICSKIYIKKRGGSHYISCHWINFLIVAFGWFSILEVIDDYFEMLDNYYEGGTVILMLFLWVLFLLYSLYFVIKKHKNVNDTGSRAFFKQLMDLQILTYTISIPSGFLFYQVVLLVR